jgi:hypothetical protein
LVAILFYLRFGIRYGFRYGASYWQTPGLTPIPQTTTFFATGIGRKFASLLQLYLSDLRKLFSPLPPISMLFVFESDGRGHFPDRSSHQQTRALHNIEIGGRGGTVNSFCFFHFDTCLSFVSLSGVVRTFVCYLSGLKFFFVCWCHFTMFCHGRVSGLWAFCNDCARSFL